MHITSIVRTTAMTILFVALGSLYYGVAVHAQSDCPAGTQPATAGDLATMRAAGIASAQVGQCWSPSNTNIGQAAGDAKTWLKQHATSGSNISCLNANFAEKLKNLMQAVPGGPPTITDGYRSPATQASLSRGATQVGPCGSYHQYGLAADFNNANQQTLLWLRTNAPRFGLTPIASLNLQTGCSYVSSFCDPGHIQIQGPHPSVDQCGMCSSNGGDGTATSVQAQPAPSNQPAPQQIASMSTGQTYSQDTICVLSTDPPSSITIPAGTPYPSSCLNGNAPSSVPQGGQSQQQAQQQSANGGYQTASNQSGISPSEIFPTPNTNPGQKTIQSPTLVTNLLTPSSTAAILAALANPQYSTTSTTTTVAVMLNPSLATSVSQLQPSTMPGVTYAQIPTAAMPQTSHTAPAYQTSGTGVIPGTHVLNGSDTFVSNDLNTSGGQDSFSQSPQVLSSNANSILNSLKVQLIAALSFLATYTQPFQGNIPSQQVGD